MKKGMKKPDRHNGGLVVKHTPECDIVEERQWNTRRYLFARAFAPYLTMNLIRPAEFAFFDVTNHYQAEIHTHRNQAEFIIAIEGRYTCSINGQAVVLNPMEGILIQYGDVHRDDCAIPCRFLALGFEMIDLLGSVWAGTILRDSKDIRNHCFSCADTSISAELICFAQKFVGANRFFMKQASYSFAQVLIWKFLDTLNAQLTSPFLELLSNNLFQVQLTKLFQDHLHGHLAVPEMAKAMGMSRKSLEMNCARILGKSPAKAFLSLKLEQAARLLKAGKSSKEVTEVLAFDNPFHFSRTFKKHFGMTVSDFCAK